MADLEIDFSSFWTSLVNKLHETPPKQKMNAFQKLTRKDNVAFKGRNLVDWLITFLQSQPDDIVTNVTPEHAYRLADTLLDFGAIETTHVSTSSSASLSSDKEKFSLQDKYTLKPKESMVQLEDLPSFSSFSSSISVDSSKSETSILSSESGKKKCKECSIVNTLSFLRQKSCPTSTKAITGSLNSKLRNRDSTSSASSILSESCKRIKPEEMQSLKDFIQNLEVEHLQVGDRVSDFQLPNAKGQLKNLGHFLKKGAVILNFMIGGACTMCCKEVQYYNDLLDPIELAGARMLIVSPETKEELAKTSKRLNIKATYLSDAGFNIMQEYGSCYETSSLDPEHAELCRKMFPGLGELYGYHGVDLPPFFPLRGTFIIDSNFVLRYAKIDFTERSEPVELFSQLKQIQLEKTYIRKTNTTNFNLKAKGKPHKRSSSSSSAKGFLKDNNRSSSRSNSSESSITSTQSNYSVTSITSQLNTPENKKNLMLAGLITFNAILLVGYFLFL